MATIHTITLPSGVSYEIEDSTARSDASNALPLAVSVTGNTVNDNITYNADKSYAQINTAYSSGRRSYIVFENSIYDLDFFDSTLRRYCYSRTYEDNGIFLDQFTINSSNVILRSSRELVRFEEMYKYAKTINIGYDNVSSNGTYGTTARITYPEGSLFWYGNHQLGRATTDIMHGDTLTINTNFVATTISDELARLPSIVNSLIATALAEYDDGDVIEYGNVEEEEES